TTTVLGYEIRSTCVHERMLEMLKREFDFKMVPKSKKNITYQHPSIQLFVMGLKLKPPEGRAVERLIQVSNNKFNEVTKTGCKSGGGGENNETMNSLDVLDGGTSSSGICESDCSLRGDNIGDWKVRRYGAMAARLLRDVKIKIQAETMEQMHAEEDWVMKSVEIYELHKFRDAGKLREFFKAGAPTHKRFNADKDADKKDDDSDDDEGHDDDAPAATEKVQTSSVNATKVIKYDAKNEDTITSEGLGFDDVHQEEEKQDVELAVARQKEAEQSVDIEADFPVARVEQVEA
ncbi:hypothetical protein Dimus_020233, partial [Dionaea muscipula]